MDGADNPSYPVSLYVADKYEKGVPKARKQREYFDHACKRIIIAIRSSFRNTRWAAPVLVRSCDARNKSQSRRTSRRSENRPTEICPAVVRPSSAVEGTNRVQLL